MESGDNELIFDIRDTIVKDIRIILKKKIVARENQIDQYKYYFGLCCHICRKFVTYEMYFEKNKKMLFLAKLKLFLISLGKSKIYR